MSASRRPSRGAHQVQWRPWGHDAFAEAQREDRPILLYLSASWCHWCQVMDQTSYADPEIIHLINTHFLPIQVDTDRRPDVNDRYNMGGWPSTAFLTPSGDTLTGATYIGPQELRNVLQQVQDVYRHRREDVYQRVQKAQADAQKELPVLGEEVTEAVLAQVTQTILGRFEPQHGGFDTMPKFPAPEIIDLLLFRHRLEPSDLFLGVVETTLDRMAQGELFDRPEGGFFRYANGIDWTQPHTEKLLEVNAANLSSYLYLYQATGEERHRHVAEATLSFLDRTLFDPATQAFFGSQAANEAYYRLDGQARQQATPPWIDTTVYTDRAARAASAYLHASWLLKRPFYQEKAMGCLEFLWQQMRTAEGAVYHYFDDAPHVLGLFRDHVYLLQALLDAYQVSGKADYLDHALALAAVIEGDFKNDDGPAYSDLALNAETLGFLRYRQNPLAENAALASALLTLYHLTDDQAHRERAREILEGFVPLYAKHRHFAAGYARAVAQLLVGRA